MGFADPDFRSSQLMRLRMLESLREYGLLDGELVWTDARHPRMPVATGSSVSRTR
jgi:hypothetical protein